MISFVILLILAWSFYIGYSRGLDYNFSILSPAFFLCLSQQVTTRS